MSGDARTAVIKAIDNYGDAKEAGTDASVSRPALLAAIDALVAEAVAGERAKHYVDHDPSYEHPYCNTPGCTCGCNACFSNFDLRSRA